MPLACDPLCGGTVALISCVLAVYTENACVSNFLRDKPYSEIISSPYFATL